MSRLIAVGAISLACALVAACQGRATDPSPPVAEEHMPLPASLWLTSSPAAPAGPVLVELTDPQDPEFHRSHRFPAGVELRATFPVSSGAYRLIGLDGRCGMELTILPEREADVVLTLAEDDSCSFAIADDHGYDEGVEHQEPAVLVVD